MKINIKFKDGETVVLGDLKSLEIEDWGWANVNEIAEAHIATEEDLQSLGEGFATLSSIAVEAALAYAVRDWDILGKALAEV